jgi:hypothetical protein
MPSHAQSPFSVRPALLRRCVLLHLDRGLASAFDPVEAISAKQNEMNHDCQTEQEREKSYKGSARIKQ